MLATNRERWYTVSRMKQSVAVNMRRLWYRRSETEGERHGLGDIRRPVQDPAPAGTARRGVGGAGRRAGASLTGPRPQLRPAVRGGRARRRADADREGRLREFPRASDGGFKSH